MAALSLNNNFLLNLIFSFLFLSLPIANSVSFNFTRFESNNNAGINLTGDAFRSANGVLQLTKNQVDDNLRNSTGWATYDQPVPIWDSKTGKLTDFTTHFSFSIRATDANKYGDGISFFLAPYDFSIPPNSVGGLLALFSNLENSTANQIVAVEFDSFKNIWDPDDNHVGINVNSIVSVANVTWKSSIRNGSTANAWVSYNSSTQNLSVFLTYANNPVFGGNSSLSYNVDLRKILPEQVRIGFSASTGDWVEVHNILSWSFNSSLEINNGKNNMGLIIGLVVEPSKVRLVEWVWDLYGKEQILKAVDQRLETEFDERQMECLMIVGLWCCHPDVALRPSIRQVINVLNFEAQLPSLPSKLPVAMYFAPPLSLSHFNYTSTTGGLTDSDKYPTGTSNTSSSAYSSMSIGDITERRFCLAAVEKEEDEGTTPQSTSEKVKTMSGRIRVFNIEDWLKEYSGGRLIKYALGPNFFNIWKGPARLAYSLVKLFGGNRSGRSRIKTWSPTLNWTFFLFKFARAAYSSVLVAIRLLISSCRVVI
ncbi:hypothetical protein EZV62_014624 [Acer yangbiense]|uniref:Legume lectin domain-containing protein n=1 Tax=Acer yangbiense TaxID=1000413 RepID=A0A5C7HSP9_9ROSI|nr:hypothetical protein EZV62_014624 [Acer yangbiense]